MRSDRNNNINNKNEKILVRLGRGGGFLWCVTRKKKINIGNPEQHKWLSHVCVGNFFLSVIVHLKTYTRLEYYIIVYSSYAAKEGARE